MDGPAREWMGSSWCAGPVCPDLGVFFPLWYSLQQDFEMEYRMSEFNYSIRFWVRECDPNLADDHGHMVW
jgi:hypothetical protein